jgi:flagellar M-ring protein FliF
MSRRTENVTYQTTRTVRQVKTPRGAIKRISASLLLDQDFRWDGKGPKARRVDVPPTPEKLKAIHDIVAGVLGLDPARGDQLVIESLPFEQTREMDEPAVTLPKPSTTPVSGINEFIRNRPAVLGGAVLLLIVGALLAMRFRAKSRSKHSVQQAAALEKGQSRPGLESGKAAETLKVAGDETKQKLPLPAVPNKVDMLRQQLRETVNRDPALAASVIRGWLEEEPNR